MNRAPRKNALLFYNQRKPETRRWVERVRRVLRRKNIRVLPEGSAEPADFAIAVGGDGTMLRAARAVAPHGVPLAGINTGALGFLSGTEPDEAAEDVERIADGLFPVEERRMLSAEVFRGSTRLFGPAPALNDCVVKAAAYARAFFLEASLGDEFLTNFYGDGLIVSTPTGSTAYALAANGPIVEPTLDVFIAAPICPHDLTQRPLVLPFDRPLVVRLASERSDKKVPGLVSLDGQINRLLRPGDSVVVRRYERPFRLLVNPRRHYFQVLRTKLNWGAETRRKKL